jgi:hypothetical protein
MNSAVGWIEEIRLSPTGGASAWIRCAPAVIPAAGQYLLAWQVGDWMSPLGEALYLEQCSGQGFWAAAPIQPAWGPGTQLILHGPLGRGFQLPAGVSRLALAALGDSVGRLLPVLDDLAPATSAIALFADCPLPVLPAAVEIGPLSELRQALSWADFLLLDLQRADLERLSTVLGVAKDHLHCPGQALVRASLPCGGLAACGVCGVPTRGGKYLLACQDGPVFNIRDLEW